MDVEQLCRDHGAAEVAIARGLTEIDEQELPARFDAAVVDLMLGGTSTLDFAARLHTAGIPFVFASGYSDSDDLKSAFPEIRLVSKPYSGEDLIAALAAACGRAEAA
ncbi:MULTISPECIES: response regulator [unclassified Mesorhizobium]|uniref:response regulator n=1 Tax=unclassified Mesorhizobium TaxID=325217 RepID=UPI0013EDCCD7|nr:MULTISPECIES: response regulator [unclassified Mesorhizobium]